MQVRRSGAAVLLGICRLQTHQLHDLAGISSFSCYRAAYINHYATTAPHDTDKKHLLPLCLRFMHAVCLLILQGQRISHSSCE